MGCVQGLQATSALSGCGTTTPARWVIVAPNGVGVKDGNGGREEEGVRGPGRPAMKGVGGKRGSHAGRGRQGKSGKTCV